ncbi:MAG: IS66 family insertion sequence element accessory protein TnpB [Sphingobacteriales bacterium]|nr:IS66 family insertion sequence element accessory protein TnpB [Sphingobacteriales bacterium]
MGGDGLAIYHKRLEKGVYELPRLCADNSCAQIDALQLQLILQGIVLQSVRKKGVFHSLFRNSKSYTHLFFVR